MRDIIVTTPKSEMNNSLLQVLKEIKGKIKVKREYKDDLDYYILEEISKIGNLNDEKTIKEATSKSKEILSSVKRSIWVAMKKQGKEKTYGSDPDNSKALDQTGETWSFKAEVYFPSDRLPDQTIKFILPDENDIMDQLIEDYEVIGKLDKLERDGGLRDSIDAMGGKHTADIYALVFKYRPVKISNKMIKQKLGISERTIKRRLAWIKGNEHRIEDLIISKDDEN
jgi:hypothetical protein